MTAESISSTLTSIGPALANHLWQSTLFVAAMGLLTLLLRRNQARFRYSLWFAASVKFLVPFSLLIALGGALPSPRHVASGSQTALYAAIDVAGQPFAGVSASHAGSAVPAVSLLQRLTAELPLILAGIWLIGALVVLLAWYARWRQVSTTLGRSLPSQHGREVTLLRRLEEADGKGERVFLRLSRELMEPGVFGVFRPVLVWPEGLSERLDDEQMEAILAHELCHLRRRDNLTAAIHMLVEALFWFHPMVWWMERHLVEERELACDEAVVELGSRPEAYAESLLKACRFCVESPLACVSGITGADLNRRLRSIMALRLGHQLGLKGKLLLAIAALATVAAPLMFGIVSAAQTTAGQAASGHSPTIPAWHTVAGDDAGSTTEPLTFEVASVKPSRSKETFFNSGFLPGGDGYNAENITLLFLIRTAYGLYNVPDEQFEGLPKWAKTERFDVVAKVNAGDVKELHEITRAQRGMMIQELLADRFKLRVHFQPRELPVYELAIAKNGPKLEEAAPGTGDSGGSKTAGDLKQGAGSLRMAPGQLRGQAADMWALKAVLSPIVGRTVLDKTGLTGNYNFELDWAPDDLSAPTSGAADKSSDPSAPSIFSALQEQLGLKLQPAKGPVDTLVIDHVQEPSSN